MRFGFDLLDHIPENIWHYVSCSSANQPLTPYEAFTYYYGKAALFYKTGELKGFYGEFRSANAVESEEHRPTPRIDVHKFNLDGSIGYHFDGPNSGFRWATHELGHYFEWRINDIVGSNYVRNQLGEDTQIQRRGIDNRKKTYGFYGVLYGWQQSPVKYTFDAEGNKIAVPSTGEEFADMFLGWNYNKWELENPNDETVLSKAGEARSNFMDRNMAFWIALVINRERQITR